MTIKTDTLSYNCGNIRLKSQYAAVWREYCFGKTKIWIRGTVYFEGRFYRENDLPAIFLRLATLLDNATLIDFSNLLNQLSGFFALVIWKDQSFFAAVDRVRSIPLFYGQANGQIFLSDDAEWIRQSLGVVEMDQIALQEFRYTGYVTGQETLFSNIRQLQTGEMLHITTGKDRPQLNTKRYYRFIHDEPAGYVDEDTLSKELENVSEKSAQRLIDYANGRQIVVPLSAGYDSRLIVILLRQLGYENVLTFSYGAPDNYESKISKSVAESLNYKWEFVNYSNSLWKKWWNTKERMAYQWWASEWTSLPVFQDWPAVWQLRLSGKLEDGAIFAPGHSADLLAGSRSRIFPALYEHGKMETEQVIDAIFKFNYSHFPIQKTDYDTQSFFRKKVLDNLNPMSDYTNKASAFEYWDVNERQAKFIINSVRAYEFWGYDWYLPLWDSDFMLFWQKISLHLRKEQFLYIKLVDKLYKNQCVNLGVTNVVSELQDSVRPSKLRSFIKKSPIGPALIALYQFHDIMYYYTHPLRWYGIVTIGDYVKLNTKDLINILISLYLLDAKKLKEREEAGRSIT